jgi:carbamate kinase
MRVVIALGGNALLQRGQALSAENMRANVRRAALAIAVVIKAGHEVIISHGNGPQVGLLALENAAYKEGTLYPLDVLSAESMGMIGYLIEQELGNLFPSEKLFATLLTQVEVDPADPAFQNPTKPIGPVYGEAEATTIGKAQGWTMGKDGDKYRRLVASPEPRHIFQVDVINLLVGKGVTVICTGGGGVPVIRHQDGSFGGAEAVIDKDRASALLAAKISADALLMLTDVDGVFQNWGTIQQARISRLSADQADPKQFPAGSMGPKVAAAVSFVKAGGRFAGIGKLDDALAIMNGKAGTQITGQ